MSIPSARKKPAAEKVMGKTMESQVSQGVTMRNVWRKLGVGKQREMSQRSCVLSGKRDSNPRPAPLDPEDLVGAESHVHVVMPKFDQR